MDLAKQIGLDEVNVEDFETVLQETDKILSNDGLKKVRGQY